MEDNKGLARTTGADKVCRKCGATFRGHFCSQCGAKAEEEMTFCPVCGVDRESGELFCSNCGFSYGAEGRTEKHEVEAVVVAELVVETVAATTKEETPAFEQEHVVVASVVEETVTEEQFEEEAVEEVPAEQPVQVELELEEIATPAPICEVVETAESEAEPDTIVAPITFVEQPKPAPVAVKRVEKKPALSIWKNWSKQTKTIVCVALGVVLLATLLLLIFGNGNRTDSGLTYVLEELVYTDAEGRPLYSLTISGKGSMDQKSTKYPWSNKKDQIREITIEQGVTTIGASAFEGCGNVQTITLPQGLEAIGDSAFAGCDSVVFLSIPKTVRTIGKEAFKGCSKLRQLTIANGVQELGNYAFSDCVSLTAVTIPSTVTTVGGGCFYGCTALNGVTIEDGVKNIVSTAFGNCSNISSAFIPAHAIFAITGVARNSLTYVRISSGVIPARAFADCVNLDYLVLENGVVEIEEFAFIGCISLSNVIIPSTVVSVGKRIFYGCTNLERVNCFASQKPANWHDDWAYSVEGAIAWGYEGDIN